MADAYARSVARAVVGQIAENAGYETAYDSSIEVLSELMIRYVSEVALGAHSYAETAGRTDANAFDTLLAIEDVGTSAEELKVYLNSISEEESAFAHTLPQFPIRGAGRSLPTFEQRGDEAPSHIPSFLPSFPDSHTYQHTPSYDGHEENPGKQTQGPLESQTNASVSLFSDDSSPQSPQVIQKQRHAAEKALVQLHDRLKAAAAPQAAAKTGEETESHNIFLAPPMSVLVKHEQPGREAADAVTEQSEGLDWKYVHHVDTVTETVSQPLGFSLDWATATHKQAASLAARRKLEDAYKDAGPSTSSGGSLLP
eukprot:gene18775-25314_t